MSKKRGENSLFFGPAKVSHFSLMHIPFSLSHAQMQSTNKTTIDYIAIIEDILKTTHHVTSEFEKTRCFNRKRYLMDILIHLTCQMIMDPNISCLINPKSLDNFRNVIREKLEENSWYLLHYSQYYKIVCGKHSKIHPAGFHKYGKLQSAL
jgi:hypothetical protein